MCVYICGGARGEGQGWAMWLHKVCLCVRARNFSTSRALPIRRPQFAAPMAADPILLFALLPIALVVLGIMTLAARASSRQVPAHDAHNSSSSNPSSPLAPSSPPVQHGRRSGKKGRHHRAAAEAPAHHDLSPEKEAPTVPSLTSRPSPSSPSLDALRDELRAELRAAEARIAEMAVERDQAVAGKARAEDDAATARSEAARLRASLAEAEAARLAETGRLRASLSEAEAVRLAETARLRASLAETEKRLAALPSSPQPPPSSPPAALAAGAADTAEFVALRERLEAVRQERDVLEETVESQRAVLARLEESRDAAEERARGAEEGLRKASRRDGSGEDGGPVVPESWLTEAERRADVLADANASLMGEVGALRARVNELRVQVELADCSPFKGLGGAAGGGGVHDFFAPHRSILDDLGDDDDDDDVGEEGDGGRGRGGPESIPLELSPDRFGGRTAKSPVRPPRSSVSVGVGVGAGGGTTTTTPAWRK
jgi:hypothetical protein